MRFWWRVDVMKYSTQLIGVAATLLLSACGAGGSGDVGSLDGEWTFTRPCSFDKPNPVDFGPVTDAEINTLYLSNVVAVSGLGDGCTWAVFGDDDSTQTYSINGGAFTYELGEVRNGDRLQLRHVSHGIYASASYYIVINNGFHVTTRTGRPEDAPIVTILAPTDYATVHASRIVVSGTATDVDGVTKIAVFSDDPNLNIGGVAATSNDLFATWQAELALVSGRNVITVTSVDALNNWNHAAAEISIDNLATVLEDPSAMESDISNSRLLVVDKSLRALLAIDLISGQHTVLSDANIPDGVVLFTDPAKLVISSSGSTGWVLDRAYDDVVQVDLATGVRTLVVDTVGGGLPVSLSNATDLVFDEANGRLLLVMGEEATAQVVSLDLASGERTVLSDADTPNSETPFQSPKSLALDTIGNRLLVVQRNFAPQDLSGNAIVAVDPTTGHREIIIDHSILTNDPTDADVDIDNDRVLILQISRYYNRGEILTFNLASNELTTLYSTYTSSSVQLARDPLNNRLLLLYDGSNSIRAIDLATGEISIAY
jgi:hypothetical protein